MTLWLANLAAYSVQLAALVGTGAVLVAILRLDAPRATLRFWQIVFASSLLWPAYQLWANADASRFASARLLGEVFAGGVLWSAASSSAAGMRAGIAAMDPGVTTLVIAVLASGTAIRLGWLGLGLMKLRSIRLASESAHTVSSIAVPLQHALGVTAAIRFSDAVDSPATIGARHPTVLLPRRVGDLPVPVQRAVLCHELIHVRRRDWLPVVFEELWCAVLWFHPAARALASRLSLARETCVDQATIAQTRDRRAYAAALLEFSTASRRLVGVTSLIGRRHLERRIALIAQEVSMPRSSLAVRLALAAAVVAIVTLATTSNVPITATLQAQTEKVYKPGEDTRVTLPRVVREVMPQYTPEAMQAKIQGSVWMTVVVMASGDVGDITVSRSLDTEYGLDQQAIDATRQWKFEPGTREGKPVPVEVTIEMTFTLKK
jgi:TonB family protein